MGTGVGVAGPWLAITSASMSPSSALVVLPPEQVRAAALRSQAARAVRESVVSADSSTGPRVPAHCCTREFRFRSVELVLPLARAAKVGLPSTRVVAMLHRQLEQKSVSSTSVQKEVVGQAREEVVSLCLCYLVLVACGMDAGAEGHEKELAIHPRMHWLMALPAEP